MNEGVNAKDKKYRYEWVDALKALGIIAIYLGHFGESAGKLYSFVFQYHVPLFFLVAGFFTANKQAENFQCYFKRKFQHIMIPYFLFSIIFEVVYILNNDIGGNEIIKITIKSFLGVRNNLIAPSLWFLPCLFIIYMLNYILTKVLKNKYVVLIVAFGLMVSTQSILNNNPIVTPSWIWNIDSALYYLVYFSLGNIYFQMVCKYTDSKKSIKSKLVITIFSILSIGFTIIVYLKGSWYLIRYINLGLISAQLYTVFSTLTLIFANILLSMILARIPIFVEIGKNTLIFCCTESLIKLLLQSMINMLGFTLNLSTPLVTLVYSFLCLIVSYFTLVPFLKTYFPKMIGIYKNEHIA
ncbi:acyltransferase family protein [Clostridium sp.]|uniref:acyltransferase family protein n=1 Tax=Clostridium sp. TaxID=1506 RepID=UPI0032174224